MNLNQHIRITLSAPLTSSTNRGSLQGGGVKMRNLDIVLVHSLKVIFFLVIPDRHVYEYHLPKVWDDTSQNQFFEIKLTLYAKGRLRYSIRCSVRNSNPSILIFWIIVEGIAILMNSNQHICITLSAPLTSSTNRGSLRGGGVKMRNLAIVLVCRLF